MSNEREIIELQRLIPAYKARGLKHTAHLCELILFHKQNGYYPDTETDKIKFKQLKLNL